MVNSLPARRNSRRTTGFTIVETMLVVVIIAALTTIVTVSNITTQVQTRDRVRSTKATLVAHVLEAYYDEHGEYPAVRALVNDYSENTGTAVAALLSLTDKSVLVMPNAPSGTTNSIASALGSNDVMSYAGASTIGNDNCQTNATGGCEEFTLSYKKEIDGTIVTINSAYKSRPGDYETPLKATSKPTITAIQSGTNIVATSSTFTCDTTYSYSPRYSFRERIAAGSWGAWSSWQAGNTYTRSGNANNVLYSFQVQGRCQSGTNIGDTSLISDPASVTYYTMPAAPAGPATTASQSGSYAVGTASAATCNYGTAQYLIDYRVNSGSWVSGSWGTAMTRSVTGSDSTTYGFRTTARCVNGTQTATGSAGAESSVVYYTMPTAPAGPITVATMSGANATGTTATVTCDYGTPQYLIDYRVNSGSWVSGSWGTATSRSVAGSNAATYGFRTTARCVNNTQTATGSAGAENSVVFYSTPSAPSAPSISSITSNGSTVTATTSTVSCNYGSPQYLIDYRTNDGSWSIGSWGTGTTRGVTASDGVKYGFRSTAKCVNAVVTTTGSTGAESTYVEPIATPSAPSVSTSTYTSKTWTWTAASCASGTSPYYQYQFYDDYSTAYGWVGTSSATATNVAGTSQGINYGIRVQQRCYNSYTTSGYSGSATGGTFVVPVVHVAVRYAAFKLITGAYPSMLIKSYTGTCASGLERLVGIKGDFGNTGTWTYYTGFVTATDNMTIDVTSQSVSSGSTFEVNTRARCQNTTTGYYTDAAGEVTAPMTYDIGNLYNRGSSRYNISCAPTSISSWCAAGYDSGGAKNTTNTTALACTVKASTYSYIVDTSTRFSAYFSFGANNLCWNTTP